MIVRHLSPPIPTYKVCVVCPARMSENKGTSQQNQKIQTPPISNSSLVTILSYLIFLLYTSLILISNSFWAFRVNNDVFPPKFCDNSLSPSNLLCDHIIPNLYFTILTNNVKRVALNYYVLRYIIFYQTFHLLRSSYVHTFSSAPAVRHL